jgi:TfoX/Sxy family transcriptional regulator of competence genes
MCVHFLRRPLVDGMLLAMAYDELLELRIRQVLAGKQIKYEAKRMMGGLCFMVKGKMCVGVEKNRLMARIGPEAHDDALTRKGCRPMDFTGKPMRGFVFVAPEGLGSEQDVAFWLELALAYNPIAKKSAKRKR